MKKCMLGMFAALVALFVAGCGDTNVDLVKNGILEIDETRTVEQLLGAKLNNMKWKSFKGDDNRTIVEVTGIWKDPAFRTQIEELQEAAKKFGSNNNADILSASVAIGALQLAPMLPLDGEDMLLIQFIIHADGEKFEFGYGEIIGSNGKVKEGKNGVRANSTQAYKDDRFLKLFVE
jgi:uncharacterized lipoprotein YehR (DUF1307 family)